MACRSRGPIVALMPTVVAMGYGDRFPGRCRGPTRRFHDPQPGARFVLNRGQLETIAAIVAKHRYSTFELEERGEGTSRFVSLTTKAIEPTSTRSSRSISPRSVLSRHCAAQIRAGSAGLTTSEFEVGF